ncbi:hypothetical protein RyT2_15000 [Pseudolactococcus yaeyamensis]
MADVTNPNTDPNVDPKPNETTPPAAAQGGESVSKEVFEALTAKNKAYETEKADLEARIAAFEKEKEEKSFAQMTKEQREKADLDNARKKFEAERQEFEQAKLTAEITADLAEKGLPKSLAKALSLIGDKDKIIAIVDAAVSEQQDILKANLKQQLAGKPPVRTDTGNIAVTKEQFDKMTYAERIELYANNKELYNSLSK